MGSYLTIIALRAGMPVGFSWVLFSATVLNHPAYSSFREGALVGLIFGLIYAMYRKPAAVSTTVAHADPEQSVHDAMANLGLRLERQINSVLTFRGDAANSRVVVKIDRGNVSMIGPRSMLNKLAGSFAA